MGFPSGSLGTRNKSLWWHRHLAGAGAKIKNLCHPWRAMPVLHIWNNPTGCYDLKILPMIDERFLKTFCQEMKTVMPIKWGNRLENNTILPKKQR
jgi:hypothetical protein